MKNTWQFIVDLFEKHNKWALIILGPLSLILSFGTVVVAKWPLFFLYILVYVLSFTACFFRQMRLSLVLPVLLAIFQLFYYRDLFLTAVLVSSMISLYVIWMSFREVHHTFCHEEEEIERLESKIGQLNETLTYFTKKHEQAEKDHQKILNDLHDKEDYADSLKKLANQEKKHAEILLKDKQMIAEECLQLKQQVLKLNDEIKKTQKDLTETQRSKLTVKQLNELNDLRTRYFQLQLLYEKAQRSGIVSQGEPVHQHDQKIQDLEEKCRRLRALLARGNPLEIEEQFEEKIEQLHEAKMDLLKVHAKFNQIAKEYETQAHDAPAIEKALCDYLQITDNECLRLEEENALLQEIISRLAKNAQESLPVENSVQG